MCHVFQLIVSQLDEARLPGQGSTALCRVAVDRVGDDKRGRIGRVVPAMDCRHASNTTVIVNINIVATRLSNR
mgnify:CR=1 FL=1